MGVKKSKKEVRIKIPAPYLRELDHLVEKGIYMSCQDAIRAALRDLFREHEIEPFSDFVEEAEKSQD